MKGIVKYSCTYIGILIVIRPSTRHRESRKAYQRAYSLTHSHATKCKVGKTQREAGNAFQIHFARYPAILMTNICLLEKRSQTITSAEHLLSVYISNVHRDSVTLVRLAANSPEREFVCAPCVPPSVEALLSGDHSWLGDDEDDTEPEYDLFRESEEDDDTCFPPTIHFFNNCIQ